jgi:hypothetical protein
MRRGAAAAMIITMLNGAACAPGRASPSASPSTDARDIPGIGRIEPGGYTHAPAAARILDRGTDDRLRKALAARKPITSEASSVPAGLPDTASATLLLSGGMIIGGGNCRIHQTSAEVRHEVDGTTRLSDQASTSVTDTGSHAYAYSWSRNVLCRFNVSVLSVHVLEPNAENVRLARAATKVLASAGVQLIETGAR